MDLPADAAVQCKYSSPTTYSNVKEYRSRSVVVLTPSIGFTPWDIPGIRATYKIQNISEHSKQIFSKFSGFLAIAIWGSHAKNFENRRCLFSGRWWEKFFLIPYISPNFGYRELKIKGPLDLHGPHLRSEFCDPNPTNAAWGDDRRNLKIHVFRQEGVCKIRSFLRISWIDEFFEWNIVKR